MFSLWKRKKRPLGDLTINVEYSSAFNFAIIVRIPELGLKKEVEAQDASANYGICRFAQLPAGKYEAVIESYMSSPDYRGKQYSSYQGTYGKFEQIFPVTIKPFQRNVHLVKLEWNFLTLTIKVEREGKAVDGAEVMVKEANPNFIVTKKGGEVHHTVKPGIYEVVVQYCGEFFREQIRVEEDAKFFIADLDRHAIVQPEIVEPTEIDDLEEKLANLELPEEEEETRSTQEA